jgi:hypothetical protein
MHYSGNWTAVFLIGNISYSDTSLIKQLEDEQAKFHDLLIIDELERYKGEDSVLPFKTASFLKVASLTEIPWILKTDDDSYVNIPYLLRNTEFYSPPFYGGGIGSDSKPIRDPNDLWYISYESWPSDDAYHPFASGAGYLMSNDVVSCFADVCPKMSQVQYHPCEDVFVGVLAHECKVKAQSLHDIHCCGPKEGINLPWYQKVLIKHYSGTLDQMSYYYNANPEVSIWNEMSQIALDMWLFIRGH